MRPVSSIAALAFIATALLGCTDSSVAKTGEQSADAETPLAALMLPTTTGSLRSVVDSNAAVTILQIVDAGCGLCVKNAADVLRVRERLSATPTALHVIVSSATAEEARMWAESAQLPDFVVVFADEGRKLRSATDVVGIPTLLMLNRDGREGARVMGNLDVPALQEERIEAAIVSVRDRKP